LKHVASPEFWACYRDLPEAVQALADKNFALLKAHPSILPSTWDYTIVRLQLKLRTDSCGFRSAIIPTTNVSSISNSRAEGRVKVDERLLEELEGAGEEGCLTAGSDTLGSVSKSSLARFQGSSESQRVPAFF